MSGGRTSVSDATQVVEDVVERRVGFLTCLGEQQWDCHASLRHSNRFVGATNIKDSSTSWVVFITLSPRYHNENPQNGKAVPLRHGLRHVGVQLRVVVHHVQLEGGDAVLGTRR